MMMMNMMMRTSAAAATIVIMISTLLIVCSLVEYVTGMEMEEFFPDERDALIQLRDIVKSSSNLHANWTGVPCNSKNQSRWSGVGCWDWHVTHLVLEGIQLTASLPLPPMLFHNLTFLTKLSFTNNSLHGPLPNLTNLVRLQYVFLSKNHFSGSIPPTYIDLPNLTKLELQENDLSGQIPPFNQQTLMAFNVSNNQLEGPIPETGVLQRFPESSYANNSGLCGDRIPGLRPCPVAPVPAPSQPSASRKTNDGWLQPWSIALIAAAAVLVPLSLIILTYCCCYVRVRRKAKKKEEELPAGEVYNNYIERNKGKQRCWHIEEDDDESERSVDHELEKPMFELDDLLRSAAEVIGRGKVGTTYKAMLECGSVVVVKRLEQVNKACSSKKEFAQQMQALGNMKHRNLAEMISFYHSKEEKLIVYEYVGDGSSLFSLLHEKKRGMGGVVLDWNSRVRMMKEIAEGLEHLHQRLGVPHGNLKSSNALIQQGDQGEGLLRVKLTNYGLGGLGAPAHKLSAGKTPEFVEGKRVTSKADVYCFGVVVLEMVTGRVPCRDDDDADLSRWVREAVSIEWSTDIVDLEILREKEGYEEDMLRLTEMALHCTHHLPERRPNIAQLLTTIQACILSH